VLIGSTNRASLWSGTAASRVDLHPAGASQSEIYAISGNQQGGDARVGGVLRASLWSGTAASWVDLHPAGLSSSTIYGVSGNQQAGLTQMGNVVHAGVWSGTAASWVDLNPTGSTFSIAYAVSDNMQAGYATLNNSDHAGLWSGTSASWLDLHAFVPASFSSSQSRAMYRDGVNLYVSGSGFNTESGFVEALLWTRPIPAPGGAVILGLGGMIAARRRTR
jgi:hypothetical protein